MNLSETTSEELLSKHFAKVGPHQVEVKFDRPILASEIIANLGTISENRLQCFHGKSGFSPSLIGMHTSSPGEDVAFIPSLENPLIHAGQEYASITILGVERADIEFQHLMGGDPLARMKEFVIRLGQSVQTKLGGTLHPSEIEMPKRSSRDSEFELL